MVVRVERATGPLRRATRPPLCVRHATIICLKHPRAEARRQVAAENGRVARSPSLFRKVQAHAFTLETAVHPLLITPREPPQETPRLHLGVESAYHGMLVVAVSTTNFKVV